MDKMSFGFRVLVLMGSLWLLGARPLDGVQTIWEVSPYRVHLWVAVEPAPNWLDDLAGRLAQHLAEQCQTYIGALWELEAEPAPSALARTMLADLDRLQESDLPSGWQEKDKLLFLAVRADGETYQVQAREWDVRTQSFGAVVSESAKQPAKVGRTALQTLIGAFCPLARIDRPKQGQALLRPRGMALPRPPGAPLWTGSGTVFRPVLRKSDRAGNPISIRPVDWTYLVVHRVATQGLECRIYSGLAAPLAERRRGRIEMLALALLPTQKPTLLRLADRSTSEQPLVGYDVFAYLPGQGELHFLGRSDLRGQVFVPPSPQRLWILIIASGGAPLARLPVAPGLQENLQVLLPKDSPRLAAEGFVRGFQETLLDLVAQREILLSRIQRRLQQGQTEEAAQFLQELEALRQERDALAFQLAQQEKTFTGVDPELRPKIEALWTQARQLLAQHADDRILRELADQLLQSKQTSDSPGPPPEAKP